MSQYSRVPSSEDKEDDVQVVALQVPPSSDEASTSRSTSPAQPTHLETEGNVAAMTAETTPMVNQAIEEQIVTPNTNKNTNSIISGFPMLSRIRRTIANAQAVPSSTDGVFSNLSAKPESVTEKEDENPPPYEAAAADAAPPYWETTVITPGVNGDEVFVEGLPVGNFFAFVWNMLVSMSFQFVGFLLTYLLHTSHAAKNGSRAGLGITLVQYGFYLRGRVLQDDYAPYSYSDDEISEDDDVIARNAWLSYILMFLGWFIVIRSVSDYIRVRRMESVVRTTPEENV
jgi:hypothetical protein